MIVFDVEIEKAIPGRGETPIEGIEYCQGWRDFANMGITVVSTYDTDTHLTRVFLKEDLGDLATYLYGKSTAGFNTRRFDIPLLHEHGVDISDTNNGAWHYDILEQIWLAQHLDPDRFVPATHGGWGLDAVCKATLGVTKNGHGAAAPVWWQQGRRGRVIDYCCHDVFLEGALLQWIIDGKPVTNGRQTIKVRPPAECRSSSTSRESVSDTSAYSGGLGIVRGK